MRRFTGIPARLLGSSWRAFVSRRALRHRDYGSWRIGSRSIVVADGDKVATPIRVFFRKSENERIVQFDLAAFYTLRDGLITEIREILDSFDLVQQILERDVAEALTGRPGGI